MVVRFLPFSIIRLRSLEASYIIKLVSPYNHINYVVQFYPSAQFFAFAFFFLDGFVK